MMTSKRCWILKRISLMLCLVVPHVMMVDALSSSPTTAARQFIELTNPLKPGGPDLLPCSFVSSWPTWVLSSDDDNNDLIKIPDDNGFLPPTSVDELWQPIDLQPPQLRLAVGLHVRDGVIRHVLPAVDLSFDTNNKHRNRGLCSVPRAYNWMDFQATAGEWGDYSLTLQTRNNGDEDEWSSSVIAVDSIDAQVKAAIAAITEQPPEELGDGSNLIHVVCCENNVVECPKPGTEFRVLLIEEGFDDVVGALQIKVEKTAAGSDSEYLPEAYQELFQDESLRRPAFVEMKKRIEKRDSKQK